MSSLRSSVRACAIGLLLFISSLAPGQSPPTFEVATIKPSAPDARASAIFMPPGGRLEVINKTPREILADAYGIQPYQVLGGPTWFDSARYDITAKAATEIRRDQALLRLQSLLTERLQLSLRKETRQLPIYNLVVAGKNGKLGPKLLPAKAGCLTPDPTDPLAVDPMRLCGAFELGPEGLTLTSASVGSLAPRLSLLLGRNVVDKTGLTRTFDVEIEWNPDEAIAMRPPSGKGPRDTGGPSIFTVFHEQLGLDLKAAKGPVEVLVIQRAERPAVN